MANSRADASVGAPQRVVGRDALDPVAGPDGVVDGAVGVGQAAEHVRGHAAPGEGEDHHGALGDGLGALGAGVEGLVVAGDRRLETQRLLGAVAHGGAEPEVAVGRVAHVVAAVQGAGADADGERVVAVDLALGHVGRLHVGPAARVVRVAVVVDRLGPVDDDAVPGGGSGSGA